LGAHTALLGAQDGPRNGNNLPPAPPTARLTRFRFAPDASTNLRGLWRLSVTEQRERVACLGGSLNRDSAVVTNVLLLEPRRADSLGVSAQTSIDTCGPPDWIGTVHTHIAHLDNGDPYDRLSGADRGVMQMWWRKWRHDGVFCVLYSETEAYCEMNGATGIRLPSRGVY
jgi:hypothetical protein